MASKEVKDINEKCKEVSSWKMADVEYVFDPLWNRFGKGKERDIGPVIAFFVCIASLAYFKNFRDKCSDWEEICNTMLPTGSTKISNIICFHGPAGSGKSCASKIVMQYLAKKRYTSIDIFPFAGIAKKLLRAMLEPVFPMINYDRKLYGSQEEKALPIEELNGYSMRECMIMFCNSVFKEICGKNVWSQVWKKSIAKSNAIVDDLRFPVEVQALETLAKNRPKTTNVIVVALHNTGRNVYGNTSNNESEKRLPDDDLQEKFGSKFLSVCHNGKDLNEIRDPLVKFLDGILAKGVTKSLCE